MDEREHGSSIRTGRQMRRLERKRSAALGGARALRLLKGILPLVTNIPAAPLAFWDVLEDGGNPQTLKDILRNPTEHSGPGLARLVWERAGVLQRVGRRVAKTADSYSNTAGSVLVHACRHSDVSFSSADRSAAQPQPSL